MNQPKPALGDNIALKLDEVALTLKTQVHCLDVLLDLALLFEPYMADTARSTFY